MQRIHLGKNILLLDEHINLPAGCFDIANGYPRIRPRGEKLYVAVHRFLMPVNSGYQVDHINRNKLDNRMCNLRYATASQNAANRKRNTKNTSGFKGVSRRKKNYEAGIKVNAKTIYLGRFASAELAHAAYMSAARLYFGEYASDGQ